MKKLMGVLTILFVGLLTTMSVYADAVREGSWILVHRQPYYSGNQWSIVGEGFDVNADFRSARALLTIQNPNDLEWSGRFQLPIEIQGLTYDAEARQVVYQSESRRVVCQESVSGVARLTHNCVFHSRVSSQRRIDPNTYQTTSVESFDVYLELR